jgi:hypothetical protein
MAGFRLKRQLLERQGPEASGVLLCIDFGTAACKAAATVGRPEDLLLLPLGEASGDKTQKYPIASSLFLSKTGRLYFAHEAVRQSSIQKDFSTQRLDSIKSWMSRGPLIDLDAVEVGDRYNPTGVRFTQGDAITMLLAFVMDAITMQLQKRRGVRYVRRRFTRPVWGRERSTWYDQNMCKFLVRAQLVADTLSDSWNDGLPMTVVQEVLDQVRDVELPEWLVENTGALEPIAAGVSRLEHDYEHRSLAVVVDIGAGTTDMAALTAIQPHGEGTVSKALPQGTPSSRLNAGDVLDDILKRHVLDSLRQPAHDRDAIEVQANQNARLWKEQLFLTGFVQPTFSGGLIGKEVRREAFLSMESVKRFEADIWEQFQHTLESIRLVAKLYAESSFHPLSSISLIPAGGGARLPIMRRLTGARAVGDTNFEVRSLGYEPRWFSRAYGDDPDVFPKLAVAIGGASPHLPSVADKNVFLNVKSGAEN